MLNRNRSQRFEVGGKESREVGKSPDSVGGVLCVGFFFLTLVTGTGMGEGGTKDLNFRGRTVSSVGADKADALDDAHAGIDTAEYSMFPVEPSRGCQGDEKLRPVRVGTGVGHGEDTRTGELELARYFVLEFAAEDRLTTTTRPRRIPALNHEVLDHSVENDSVVVTLFGQPDEVLHRFRGVVDVQLHCTKGREERDEKPCDIGWREQHDTSVVVLEWTTFEGSHIGLELYAGSSGFGRHGLLSHVEGLGILQCVQG